MTETSQTKAFAATFIGGEGINPYSVRGYARDVRRWIGECFASREEGYWIGWERAKKQGIRVIRVKIEREATANE